MLPGHEMPEGRKVKRGWTEPAAAAKNSKSKKKSAEKGVKAKKAKPSTHTDGSELLFKTKASTSVQPVAKAERRSKRNKGADNGEQ